jgi:hypothetical protein
VAGTYCAGWLRRVFLFTLINDLGEIEMVTADRQIFVRRPLNGYARIYVTVLEALWLNNALGWCDRKGVRK